MSDFSNAGVTHSAEADGIKCDRFYFPLSKALVDLTTEEHLCV
ncbi:MAG TPA: hypothetical protein V6D50_22205 [Chroococcales cyanobacterium]